jgi:hypothetical protein
MKNRDNGHKTPDSSIRKFSDLGVNFLFQLDNELYIKLNNSHNESNSICITQNEYCFIGDWEFVRAVDPDLLGW